MRFAFDCRPVGRSVAVVAFAGLGFLTLAQPSIAADQNPLRARGNEPGWSATIGGKEIELLTNFGQDRRTFPTPRAQVTTRYVTPDGITVTIVNTPCSDVMSGMFFPLTVTVEESGADTLSGCGGESVDLLTGDEWIVESIGGKPIVEDSKVTITFEDGRVFGSASCNRFTGGFTLTGEGLSIGDVASTMMACVEPDVGDQEHRFFEALAGVTGFEITPDGGLVLRGNSGPLVVARR
jgi:heat shock protein HslJ